MKSSTPRTSKRTIPAIIALLLLGSAPLTLAANFPERLASEQRSAEVGLGADKLQLLQRLPGAGAEKTAALLLERLHGRLPGVFTSDRFQREVTEEKTSFISDEGWHMTVYGDGTSVRYRNDGYMEKLSKLAVPLEKRIPPEELEPLGRAFIAENLQGLVELGQGEELVPYFTEVELTGGGGTEKGARMEPEMVHSNTIIFTRSVNGLPVLGGGSKVAIIFDNQGTAVGFDLDWPSYAPTRQVQTILPVERIRGRAAEVLPAKAEAPDLEVRHFECGWIDLGARKRATTAQETHGSGRTGVPRLAEAQSRGRADTIEIPDALPLDEWSWSDGDPEDAGLEPEPPEAPDLRTEPFESLPGREWSDRGGAI